MLVEIADGARGVGREQAVVELVVGDVIELRVVSYLLLWSFISALFAFLVVVASRLDLLRDALQIGFVLANLATNFLSLPLQFRLHL